jgi:hypothetical protein
VFKVHRGFIAESTVEPLPIVIHFGILEEVLAGLGPAELKCLETFGMTTLGSVWAGGRCRSS